ncbi:MAG: Cell division protein FtsX [Parcubacteria group bacterium GW2011_GWE2_39_37]|uniref:Cell division protein FtsX n=1 Tax=Candidatus Falkowbacteria bacterium GW2011_GWF2_39_8 TaxID=1618642 RepID=A0A0G0Q407_9BACT|nr:MAG: Cell division protein FtsX [Parcubacteria group bacterium GW2011_GWE2_39_37]KKR32096.1 MAG: Cell division protein FtsX [Candidatus Falkowbacteria bacterium GW2011_GWF2_39_8]
MKLRDTLSLSTRMFKTRKMRTFLTVLGVGVGIGTVLFLVSLGYGLQNVILSKITTADSLLSLDVSAGVSGAINLDSNTLDQISKVKNVVEVSPLVSLSSQISMEQLTGDGLVYAVKPSFFRLGGINAETGKVFEKEDSHEAVISSAAAKLFNLEKESVLGKEVSLTLFLPKINEEGLEETGVVKRNDKYKITGVIDDDSTSYVFVPANTLGDLGINSYNQLKIKVADTKYTDEIRNEIIDKGFLVSSLSDTIEQANKIFRIVQIVLSLFGLIALIVSAIGMFNTMTIALLERINEIGIMRSIGASKVDIMVLFLIESLLMGFLGGVGGIAVGYLAGELANFGINIMAKNFGGQALNLFYRPMWFIGFILIFSSVIGFLTGVYPARKAATINPLTALKYK